MPAPARKASPRKIAPATAARREVKAEGGESSIIKVPYRGDTFEITRDHLGSWKVWSLNRLHNQQKMVETLNDLVFAILGRTDAARFIALAKPGDDFESSCNEFLTALNKASNVPNS